MKYFKTFENCIVTSGSKRSLISDLQFGNSEFIPNSMAEIIKKLNANLPVEQLFEEFDMDERVIVQEYIEFLEKKNFGQYYDYNDILRFIELEKEFYSPEEISNIIIESGKKLLRISTIFFHKIIQLAVKIYVLYFMKV
ncbi:MAG: hypothetical protein K0R36_2387 [Chryseobacterium sp.]|jgi:hypothetical protein|nr:hypothetical protein [Chryseobacterium sp.]